MLDAFPIGDRWRDVNGGVGGEFREGVREPELSEDGVRAEGKMVAVLLDGAGGNDDECAVFVGKVIEGGLRERAEVTRAVGGPHGRRRGLN